MFEKPFFHKLNLISDWILRIVILNIFLVFSTLLVVTLYQAFLLVISYLKNGKREKTRQYLKGFGLILKKILKEK